MRDAKPAKATSRPQAGPSCAAPAAVSAVSRSAAASARADLRSAWWPWPRSLDLAGWPASARARRAAK